MLKHLSWRIFQQKAVNTGLHGGPQKRQIGALAKYQPFGIRNSRANLLYISEGFSRQLGNFNLDDDEVRSRR